MFLFMQKLPTTLISEGIDMFEEKRVVSIGLAMEAYQPAEKRFGLTHQLLEALKENSCPFSVGTKSDSILRDIDIVSEATEKSPCVVSWSITTLDGNLAKLIEPNAPLQEGG